MSVSILGDVWTEAVLGDLGFITGGSTPSTKEPSYWNGTIPWLTPSEVTRSRTLTIAETERTITKQGLKSCAAKLLSVGTVLMTSRATIGEAIINSVPMATNQGFINLTCDESKVFNEFLVYWIKQNKHVFIDRAHGVTFKEITKSNFKTIPIQLPPLREQRAIAYALRTIEEAREAREHERDNLDELFRAMREELMTGRLTATALIEETTT